MFLEPNKVQVMLATIFSIELKLRSSSRHHTVLLDVNPRQVSESWRHTPQYDEGFIPSCPSMEATDRTNCRPGQLVLDVDRWKYWSPWWQCVTLKNNPHCYPGDSIEGTAGNKPHDVRGQTNTTAHSHVLSHIRHSTRSITICAHISYDSHNPKDKMNVSRITLFQTRLTFIISTVDWDHFHRCRHRS